MGPRPAALPPALALRRRTVAVGSEHAVLRREHRHRRHWLVDRRGEGFVRDEVVVLRAVLLLALRVLRLALLQPGDERDREEDRRVRAGADADEQREREVLERLAAEDEQRDQRQQRDQRRRE